MANQRWPEQLEQALTKMWLAGISASRIGASLGGISRGAVCGKAKRLGLTGRGREKPLPEIKSVSVERRPNGETDNLARGSLHRINRGSANTKSGSLAPEDDPVGIGIMELTPTTCRWPYGDGPITFCGCEVIRSESPYCEAHRAVAYEGRPVLKHRIRIDEIGSGRGGIFGRTL